MGGAQVRAVEIEAYRRSQASLAAMLDALAGCPPRTITRALHEREPPSILSPHDPEYGRYAWTLITARADAGDDHYIPKVARPIARAVAMTYGRESAEHRETTAILRTARESRAPRVRAAVIRADKRLDRRRARYGPIHPRTLRAARRARRLQLRAGHFDAVTARFDATLDALRHDDAVWRVLFELQDLADDYAEPGMLDDAAAAAERARAWVAGDTLPATHRDDARMQADLDLFDRCMAAGQVRRCGEVAAAIDEQTRDDAAPGFRAHHAATAQYLNGRLALLRHDHREAVAPLRRALDYEVAQGRRESGTRHIRCNLLLALVSLPDDPDGGAGR